jgi:hypothetical protein
MRPIRGGGVGALLVLLVACNSSTDGDGSNPNGPMGGGPGDGGGGSSGDGGGGSGGGDGGGAPGKGPIDLCAGLVSDLSAHPMTMLAKPALGATVTDAEFGTTIRRITAVAATGSNPAIVPLYTTVSAWNADESKMILFDVSGTHRLYDGKTYAPIGALDISPADVEQIYWHTSDPDVFFYVDNTSFIRFHVSTMTKETLTTFSFCSSGASGGDDPMFTSFDSARIGLKCGDQVFIYDIAANMVLGRQTITENPAQVSPSGTLAYLSDSGRVTDPSLNVLRTLDLKEPFGHASMGRLPTGEDTWNGQAFDNGPMGDDDVGNLVVFKLTDGTSKTIIGPKTGYPYPPDGHVSALAYKQPGWMFVSTYGNSSGAGLLDLENLIADTSTGAVCRIGRHRSLGKGNTKLGTPYWAEAHTTPSPSGTRAVFASDWGGGATVDSYVVELPSYHP